MGRRIAADGKPFDQDFLGRETFPDEVEIIQYIRPNGLRRRMTLSKMNVKRSEGRYPTDEKEG